MGDGTTESLWRAIDHSSGRGQIRPIGHLEDYEVFLLYINKFNTDFGRICFCFNKVLGGVMRAIGESFICVSCLYKQMPFVSSWLEVYTNTSDFCINTLDFRIGPSDLYRYRPILRPISFVVRYYHLDNTFIHSNIIHLISIIGHPWAYTSSKTVKI